MMNLLDKLLMSGSGQNTQTMGMPTVPTDASQLRVPQMPLDPASVPVAAGANAAANLPATMTAPSASPLGGILMGLAQGAGMAMGGGKQQQEAPVVAYRGGSRYKRPEGNISDARMANKGGILSG